jgi:NAD-dependent dihydropyrimidine dehydrogenase PreA subunit
MIQIDEELCNGCGNCIPNCEEGALKLVDGKARVVSESFCDGLGACIGHCPTGALTLVERETVPFDEEAAMQHVTRVKPTEEDLEQVLVYGTEQIDQADFGPPPIGETPSHLSQWPVKLRLVSPQHPALEGSRLLIVADCASLAYSSLHKDFLKGRAVVMFCPKFEDYDKNVQQLYLLLSANNIKDVTVVHLEVPCCRGILRMTQDAIFRSGSRIPLQAFTVGVRGEIQRSSQRKRAMAATSA